MSRFVVSVLTAMVLSAAPSWVNAAEQGAPISVNVNMARVLRINAPASTVIVGNPAVADVTIQDPQTLILTGKSYGQTNLIVLDAAGNPIADTLLQVVQLQAGTMTIYDGLQRRSMSCNPVCQPVIMLGDDSQYLIGNINDSGLIGRPAN